MSSSGLNAVALTVIVDELTGREIWQKAGFLAKKRQPAGCLF